MRSDNLIKVNLGSGPTGKSDWINLDWGILPLLSKMSWISHVLVKLGLLSKNYLTPWPKNLKLYDCRKRLPFTDKSVDFIYTSHFLEHLYRYQAIELLRECKRILKPEGVIRIVVPDLAILAQKYVNRDRLFYKRLYQNSEVKEQASGNIADQLVQNFYGYDSWSKPNLIQKIQRLFIRGHLWMYDFESLNSILNMVGFQKTKMCKPGIGQVPDNDNLDIHKIGSLIIEAMK